MNDILELLVQINSVRRSFKRVRRAAAAAAAVTAIFTIEEAGEIVRNAAAYGWEIGSGQEMLAELTASPDNPFIDPTLGIAGESNA